MKIIAHDAPAILEQVTEGKLSIPKTLKVAALPVEDCPAAIERIHRKETEDEGKKDLLDRWSGGDWWRIDSSSKPSFIVMQCGFCGGDVRMMLLKFIVRR